MLHVHFSELLFSKQLETSFSSRLLKTVTPTPPKPDTLIFLMVTAYPFATFD